MFFLLLYHAISSIWGKVGHSYWRRLLSKEHVFKSSNLRSGTWSCLLSEVRQDVVVEDVVSDMPLLMLYSGLSHYLDGASLVQSSQTKRIVLVPLRRGRYGLDKQQGAWFSPKEGRIGPKFGQINDFLISDFSTFLALRAKMYRHVIWKSHEFVQFSAIWPALEPNFTSLFRDILYI